MRRVSFLWRFMQRRVLYASRADKQRGCPATHRTSCLFKTHIEETDKFSDYILTYTDEVKKANEENKGKLDDVPKTGIINKTIQVYGVL